MRKRRWQEGRQTEHVSEAHTLPLTCHLRCNRLRLHNLTPSTACNAILHLRPTCPPAPSVSPALLRVVPA